MSNKYGSDMGKYQSQRQQFEKSKKSSFIEKKPTQKKRIDLNRPPSEQELREAHESLKLLKSKFLNGQREEFGGPRQKYNVDKKFDGKNLERNQKKNNDFNDNYRKVWKPEVEEYENEEDNYNYNQKNAGYNSRNETKKKKGYGNYGDDNNYQENYMTKNTQNYQNYNYDKNNNNSSKRINENYDEKKPNYPNKNANKGKYYNEEDERPAFTNKNAFNNNNYNDDEDYYNNRIPTNNKNKNNKINLDEIPAIANQKGNNYNKNKGNNDYNEGNYKKNTARNNYEEEEEDEEDNYYSKGYNKNNNNKKNEIQRNNNQNKNNRPKEKEKFDEMPAFTQKKGYDISNIGNEQEEEEEEEEENIELVECPQGCGRSFAKKSIAKHSKICKKVFQSKRKEFNKARVVVVNNEEIVIGEDKNKNDNKKKSNKWKLQSEAFRSVLKQAKGATLTKEEQIKVKELTDQSNGLVKCDHCGRKFNENTAVRHIPFCKEKTEKDKLKLMNKKNMKNLKKY